MDRYQKVEKAKPETPIDENEIRITSKGKMRSYITYAMTLLQEKGSEEIVFKAMGRAINKTVTIVELIKRRIIGLHQITAIQSTDITDTWEPLEEGLQILETTRKVSMVTITLSKNELDKTNIGYQPPIPADQVKVSTELDYDGEGSPPARGRGRFGRGRGRARGGPSGNDFGPVDYEDGGYERDRRYNRGRGRGRGRGRNFNGRGRGGYDSPPMDMQYDGTNYNQEAPRGNDFGPGDYEEGGYERDRGYNRGRGRGRGRNFNGRGRGGYNAPPMDMQYDDANYNQEAPRGNDFGPVDYEDGSYERDRGYNRGRGRGRGRNFNGRGRGGYDAPPMDMQYDGANYNQEAPRGNDFGPVDYEDGGYERDRGYNRGRGRGRGRGRNFNGRGRGGYDDAPPMDMQYDGANYNQEAPRGRGGRGRGTRGRGRGFGYNGPVEAVH